MLMRVVQKNLFKHFQVSCNKIKALQFYFMNKGIHAKKQVFFSSNHLRNHRNQVFSNISRDLSISDD